jgi:hypothetical protein
VDSRNLDGTELDHTDLAISTGVSDNQEEGQIGYPVITVFFGMNTQRLLNGAAAGRAAHDLSGVTEGPASAERVSDESQQWQD